VSLGARYDSPLPAARYSPHRLSSLHLHPYPARRSLPCEASGACCGVADIVLMGSLLIAEARLSCRAVSLYFGIFNEYVYEGGFVCSRARALSRSRGFQSALGGRRIGGLTVQVLCRVEIATAAKNKGQNGVRYPPAGRIHVITTVRLGEHISPSPESSEARGWGAIAVPPLRRHTHVTISASMSGASFPASVGDVIELDIMGRLVFFFAQTGGWWRMGDRVIGDRERQRERIGKS
jgi:hypothetical protein